MAKSPLYSKAAQIAAALPQESGTVEQMLAMLRNRGAKPAELEHAGRPEGDRINRSELAAHFEASVPRIQNLTKSYNKGDAKFGDYVAPGKHEDYREHLLTLPIHESPELKATKRRLVQIRDEMRQAIGDNDQVAHARLKQEFFDKQSKMDAGYDAQKLEQYKSSHWDDPNVAAHFRTTDRPGGHLNVEEIQSDWGQEGRESGFYNPSDVAEISKKKREATINASHAREKRNQAENDYMGHNSGATINKILGENPGGISSEDLRNHPDMVEYRRQQEEKEEAYIRARLAYTKARDEANSLSDAELDIKGIRKPAAPYVTNTGHWVDLALKHVLHEAARGDYDHVSFNPGSANSQMFGLDRQLQNVFYDPGQKRLGYTIKGKQTSNDHYKPVEPEELPGLIGKDLSNKLLSTEKIKTFNGDDRHYLEGNDLKMEAGGMRKFYDEIVPSAALKLARQHDPELQANPQGFSPTGGFSMPITDQLRRSVLQKGFPAFAGGGKVGGGGGDDDDLINALGEWEPDELHPANQPRFKPSPPGVVNLAEKRHTAELTNFLHTQRDERLEKQKEIVNKVRELREAGHLKFNVGDRFNDQSGRENNWPPYTVVSHYYRPQDGSFGYEYTRGEGEDQQGGMLPEYHPGVIQRMGKEAFDQAVAGRIKLGGPLGVARKAGGRVINVPGTDIRLHAEDHMGPGGEKILHIHKMTNGPKKDKSPMSDHWTKAAQTRIPPGDRNT